LTLILSMRPAICHAHVQEGLPASLSFSGKHICSCPRAPFRGLR
jgi:hypothetical protein